jgi:3-oxoacyl-[acyl-carrier-protein] synthase III
MTNIPRQIVPRVQIAIGMKSIAIFDNSARASSAVYAFPITRASVAPISAGETTT